MPPGDLHDKSAGNPIPADMKGLENDADDSTSGEIKMYQPFISLNDWFVDKIVNFSDYESMDIVYKAAGYWKRIADELRSSGYPLFTGASNVADFDETLRFKALQLDDFLDILITKTSVRSDHLYDKLRILLAQGDEYKAFKEKMKSMDFSLKCNEIWENDSVAYRCNTCALTPCMSLCAACFEENKHEGHDYTRFFSREGGACDCGNEDVIRQQGFCSKHGAGAVREETNFLEVSLPEFIFAKLIKERYDRAKSQTELAMEPLQPPSSSFMYSLSQHCDTDTFGARDIISFLQECVNYGGPMREAMARILLDKELYKTLTEGDLESFLDHPEKRVTVCLDARTKRLFEIDLQSLRLPDDNTLFPNIDQPEMWRCECLLDELVFWIIRQCFPQNLINLSLSMLSETEYRNALASRFFNWYPMVANCVRELCLFQNTHSRQGDSVQNACSRVIHISVQMLSSEALCRKLNEECDLLKMVFTVTYFLLTEVTENTAMTLDPTLRFCYNEMEMRSSASFIWDVMTIEQNPSVSQHGYWFVMGDMQNLLSHASLAVATIRNSGAFAKTYIGLLKRMQGMNQVWRIISGPHREHDSTEPVQRSFTLEFETSAVTLFNMVSAVQATQDEEAAIIFYAQVLEALKDWITTITGVPREVDHTPVPIRCCPAYTVSFHIPLHRHLSTAITHFYEFPQFRATIEALRNDPETLQKIFLHPLRIQAARSEMNAGMWVRNGSQLRAQTVIYTQPHISTAFQSPDLDLIRFCAANIDPNAVIECFLDNFLLYECFTLPNSNRASSTVAEHVEISEDGRTASAGTQTLNDEAVDEDELGEQSPAGIRRGNLQEASTLPRGISAEPNVPVSRPRTSFPQIGFLSQFEMSVAVERHSHGTPRYMLLLRREWVDPMLSGMLKLICELVVVRLNCGEAIEDTYKAEIVNCLANDTMTHSRLRSCITEKGSRGSEKIDPVFDKILSEVADFIEPDATPSGMMKQGVYKLKKQMWYNEFCPVFCMMRSGTLRSCHNVLQEAIKIDREFLKTDPLMGGVNVTDSLWIPYRLVTFVNDARHSSVSAIGRLLACNRFNQIILIILGSAVDNDVIRDTTVQMAIYLVTLGVRYALSRESASERRRILSQYHRKYSVNLSENGLSIFSAIMEAFMRETEMSGSRKILLEKALSGELDRDRIIGDGPVYYGRFFSAFAKGDKTCRQVMEKLLSEEAASASVDKEKEAEERLARQKRAEQAMKRRQAILASSHKKQQEVMQALMVKEGLSQSDVDHIDTSQPNIHLFECPICGEIDSPCTLRKPFGMLVKVTTNFLAEEQVEYSSKALSLLDTDLEISQGNCEMQATRRSWIVPRRQLAQIMHSDLLDPTTGVELKTCGHTTHVECFAMYRQSLQTDHRQANDRGREVACPLCRTVANGVLPLAVDLGFESSSRGPFDNSDEIFDALSSCVANAKKTFVNHEDELAYRKHYHTESNSGLSDILRHRNVDATESSIADKRSSNSTFLVSAVVATVERQIAFSKLNILDRRRNMRTVVTEHLLTSAVACSSRREEMSSLAALRELILQPSTFTRSTEECAPEGLLTTSDPDEALFERGEIDRDQLDALQSTPRSERLRRHSIATFPLGTTREVLMPQAPLLMFEPRSLLTRISAYVFDDRTLCRDDRILLLKILTGYIMGFATVRGSVRLLLRGGPRRLLRLAHDPSGEVDGIDEVFRKIPAQVTAALASSKTFFSSLLNSLADDDADEIVNVDDTTYSGSERIDDYQFAAELRTYIVELCRFTAEFWKECGIQDSQFSLTDDDVTIDQAIALLGLDPACLQSPVENINVWVGNYQTTISWSFRVLNQPLVGEPLNWRPRRLLELPVKYDDLFTRYFHRICKYCDKTPPNPVVCLLCANIVCLDDCCRIVRDRSNAALSEIERHADECSSSSGLFLSLNSSLIVVVRSKTAAIWGSVYLDGHGEEDRNLRRGKPLNLSKQRWRCLEYEWAEQEWQRVHQWFQLSGSAVLSALRDAYLFTR